MITRIRQYGKREPSRDAHKVYVVCEGSSDEPKYFEFFVGLSSNLNVITIPSEEGKTDPLKLAELAESLFNKELSHYKLDYLQGDRVWFVIDTDTWEEEGKIDKLRGFCHDWNESAQKDSQLLKPYSVWNVAQSNPCFEIWLYYHFYRSAPVSDEVNGFESFKQFVNSKISGGFNYDSDPVRLKDAIANAEANFGVSETESINLFATEVVFLGQEIYSFVATELAKLYNKLR